MKRVLVVLPHYLPGYKAGGPVRTIANIVEALGEEFHFSILTADRDLGDREPYPGVSPGTWHQVGAAEVCYLTPGEMGLRAFGRLLNELSFDLLCLNSFFSPWTVKTLWLRKWGWIPRKPVLLAPRGELSAGALSLKPVKKTCYLFLAKAAGLYQGVTWQATCDEEAQEVRGFFGKDLRPGSGYRGSCLRVVSDLAARPTPAALSEKRPEKRPGEARVVFLSRISRKKNLDWALGLLSRFPGAVSFDIYGPVEDGTYWQECQRLMRDLPERVQARYNWSVAPENVSRVFSQHHLFLFPTRGENFGHVVPEALSSGCLVMTSDQTPWRGLRAQKVGWDVPLDRPELWEGAWKEFLEMDQTRYQEWSQSAREFSKRFAENPSTVASMRELFLEILEGRPGPSGTEPAMAPQPFTSTSR